MPKPCLVLTLVALSAMAHCMTIGNGYRADFDMQLVNDSCVFENLTIATGTSIRQELPCRRLTCVGQHKTVFIQECTTYHCPTSKCRLERREGPYPDCCPMPVYVDF
ncbi:uncharacterized protein LOC8050953 [Ixodes scapularis]|uniref:Secreted protein, putative n=2 Tax=Ixodes TaxID=6944 RepID=B7PED1_IXOSC|nr:uncharacterized protein LOC8050953 [Ixodes scapularis]EEC04953.1 secreted protein, putative [Ixodes scapularis]|eukprot:XP_002433553.1 secreted protein, putative [Ixodes scapularis]